MGALIPLAISIAPEIAKWLLGPTAEKTTTAVTQVLQTATGTADADAQRAVIERDPDVAMQLRVELAKIAAAAEAEAKGQDLSTLQALLREGAPQGEVDRSEAANAKLFVAGWRPWIGWICGAGMAMAYVVAPCVRWIIALTHGTQPPAFDVGDLTTLLLTMLGMGGLRTYEKLKGVAGQVS